MKKLVMIIIAAVFVAGCAAVLPTTSEVPRLTQLTLLCDIRNDGVVVWTAALNADLPSIESAKTVDKAVNATRICSDEQWLANVISQQDVDAAIITSLKNEVVVIVSHQLSLHITDNAVMQAMIEQQIADLLKIGVNIVEENV